MPGTPGASGGHNRLPRETHILNGSFRADLHGSDAETVQATGQPVMPPGMKGEALKLWLAVVPGLIDTGVAKEQDTVALVQLCEAWARYRKCCKALDKVSAIHPKAAGLMRLVDAASKCFERLAGRFGLTPSDRSRLRVEAVKGSKVMTRQRA